MTYMPLMFERERPLDACPHAFCRRSGLCRNAAAGQACLRTHESADAVRHKLAAKLEHILRTVPPDLPPPRDQYELDRRMADLKRALEEADRAETARRGYA